MFLVKSYWILQNASVTAFTVSEKNQENTNRDGVKINPPLHTQISTDLEFLLRSIKNC